ncbi:MAG: NYN domain-containing protein [Mesorhizobium sp.]|nr:MAG: NYN domain-containing protein [Mesorhizobium sp.]
MQFRGLAYPIAARKIAALGFATWDLGGFVADAEQRMAWPPVGIGGCPGRGGLLAEVQGSSLLFVHHPVPFLPGLGFWGLWMSTYAFVDGSALLSLIESARTYFGIGADAAFNFGRFFLYEARADRIFFYDAFPDRKPGMDEATYQALLEKSQALFDQMNSYSGIHVKNGVARFRPKRGQEQKGVDILLAIDVYRHAVNGLDQAFIFANDGDFYPVLEALQATQTRSVLKCVRGKTPRYLYELADIVEYINELNVVVHFDRAGDDDLYGISELTPNPLLTTITDQGFGFSKTFLFEGGHSYDIYENAHHPHIYAAKGDRVIYMIRKPEVFLKYVERQFGLFPRKEPGR